MTSHSGQQNLHWLIALLVLGNSFTTRAEVIPPRRKLQILNGSPQPVEIFWIRPDGERVPNGRLRPAASTIIQTTIGHRFAVVGEEDGTEFPVTSKVPIQAFRFDPPDPDGIPGRGSAGRGDLAPPPQR